MLCTYATHSSVCFPYILISFSQQSQGGPTIVMPNYTGEIIKGSEMTNLRGITETVRNGV